MIHSNQLPSPTFVRIRHKSRLVIISFSRIENLKSELYQTNTNLLKLETELRATFQSGLQMRK